MSDHQGSAARPGIAPPTVVTPADAGTAVEILAGAFSDDPLWSWAFPDPATRRDAHRALWGLVVEGALRYPWVWLAADATATSVWIPPGGTDFSPEQEERLEPLVREVGGDTADRALEVFELLDSAHHVHAEPHYFLSLLGTDAARRGQGHGFALLADGLRRIDEEGAPAYLEASNMANVALYARYGFELVSTLRPRGGPEVATMWRPAADLTR